ncbi:hypothetical protein BTHI11S_01005 [Bosea thiooxidans]
MASYYVNKIAQPNGDHEVHDNSCAKMTAPHNRDYLGEYTSCAPAVAKAKTMYRLANGCYWCSRACHTS